jgi:hypothetical protein
MLKRLSVALVTLTLLSGSAYAQAQPQKPAPPKPEAKAAESKPTPPQPEGQPVNIKIELTITDQGGPGEAAKRTVTMIVADRKVGSIRSQGQVLVNNRFVVTLNVDATPVILKEGAIRLDLGIEYAPKPSSENAASGEGRAQLNERLSLIVTPGKPMIISQASDPTSDRKISVELTATVMK